MSTKPNTPISQANRLMHSRKYAEAIRCYVDAVLNMPSASQSISANLLISQMKYRGSRGKGKKMDVGVCFSTEGINATARANDLAAFYGEAARTRLVDASGGGGGSDLRGGAVFEVNNFSSDEYVCFIDRAIRCVIEEPLDIVHLYHPNMPNILFGVLYKLIWGACVFVDIDEIFTLSKKGQPLPVNLGDFVRDNSEFPALKVLLENKWAKIAVSLANKFDGITVNNASLKEFYDAAVVVEGANRELSPKFLSDFSNNSGFQLNKSIELLCESIGNETVSFLLQVNAQQKSYLLRCNYTHNDMDFNSKFSTEDVRLLRETELFDEKWYLETYHDVQRININPIEHYLWIGARMGCNPSRHFSTVDYLTMNPDVGEAGVNPFVHYCRSGQAEGRKVEPRRRATSPEAWLQGEVYMDESVPSVLLCAHEVNEQMFGGERSFVDMVEALGQMKLNVLIAIPNEKNSEYVELLRQKSCGLYSFPYSQWSKNRKLEEVVVGDFSHIIATNNISLVYCNTIVLVEPLVAARRAGCSTAVHARELITHDEHLCKRMGMDADNIIKRILQQTDYVIANSFATQKMFEYSSRSFHAPNVAKLDLLDIPNQISDRVVFGIISSNIPKKGIADFVEIAQHAEKLVPNAYFRVIGPMNEYIKELIEAGVPGNLEFAGYADSPLEAMKQVNVVLSLSHFAESFGRTVAEAQAARRPVIAYKWGAVPELIEEGKTGFLVGYKNVKSVVARVNKICKNPEMVESMGNAGRERILRQFSPIVLRNSLRHALSVILDETVELRSDQSRRLTIIIPVYNAPEAVERCLKSVLQYTDLSRNRVLMVNDGSSDPLIQPLLVNFARKRGFHLLVNPVNLGYTRAINRGVLWADNDDILLLNSDTIVHDGWIDGMQKVAYGIPKAGTVTAMGDNSGAFSFPKANVVNSKPNNISHSDWAKTIIECTKGAEPVEVPTGNGFCLYVRRDLIEHIGTFDEETFPRGYGEENDFCMRALKAGWKNLISPYAYVFHQRTASFGAEKGELIKAAMSIVQERYPDYGRKVKSAFNSSQIKSLRVLSANAYSDIIPVETVSPNRSPVGEPQVNPNRYRVGPERRFLSLNNVVVNWKSLRGQVGKRNAELVSVIVCVYNQYSLTNKCLNALVGANEEIDIEIILVNNGSDEETSGLLDDWAGRDKRIKVIHNFDNLNFSLGNNIGFAASRGKNIVFLNNDTEVKPGWLKPLVAPLENSAVMGTQPKLLYPDGRIQCVGIVFSGKTPLGYPIYVDEAADSPLVAKNRQFRAVTGACLALRAVDFASAGGFDPVFINGQEDVDLCFRLGNGKNAFEYVANSTVVHHEGRTKGRGRFIMHNRYTFAARWKGKFDGDDASFYAEDGFSVKEYVSDRPELDEVGISCWRAKVAR